MELVYLEEDYYGDLWFYAYDIAILKLSANVKISDAVSPVCIDWTQNYTVSNGVVGKVRVMLIFVYIMYVCKAVSRLFFRKGSKYQNFQGDSETPRAPLQMRHVTNHYSKYYQLNY